MSPGSNSHNVAGSSERRNSGSAVAMSDPQVNLPQTNSEISAALSSDFAKYNDSFQTASILAFRHELVKEKADRQQRQKDKWQKQSHAFTALAEDHDRATKNAIAIEESSKRKMRQHNEAQEKVHQNFLSSLIDETGFNRSRDRSRDTPAKSEEYVNIVKDHERLKTELKNTKAAVDKCQFELERKTNYSTAVTPELENRLRNIAADSVSKSTMIEYESQIARLTVNVSNLQKSYDQHEQHLTRLPEIEGVSDEVKALRLILGKTKEEIVKLSESMMQQKNKVELLGEDFIQAKKTFEMLSTTIKSLESGVDNCNDETRKMDGKFSKNVVDLRRDFVDFESRMQGLEGKVVSDTEWKSATEAILDQLQTGFHGSATRLNKLEANVSSVIHQEHIVQSDSLAPRADVNVLKTDVNKKIDILEREIARLDSDMDERDVEVAQEFDRIDSLLAAQEGVVDKLRQDVSSIQSQALSESSTKLPDPLPHIEKSEDRYLLKFEELANSLQQFKESSTERTDSMEVLVESQQQRFDNLSTEQLAKAIIHQTKLMYPQHPANTQQDLDHLRSKQQVMEVSLTNLWKNFNIDKEEVKSYLVKMTTFKESLTNSIETRLKDGIKFYSTGMATFLDKIENSLEIKLKDRARIEESQQAELDKVKEQMIAFKSEILEIMSKFQTGGEKIPQIEAGKLEDQVNSLDAKVTEFQNNIKKDLETRLQDHVEYFITKVITLQNVNERNFEIRLKDEKNDIESSQQVAIGKLRDQLESCSERMITFHNAVKQDLVSIQTKIGESQQIGLVKVQDRVETRFAQIQKDIGMRLEHQTNGDVHEALKQVEGSFEEKLSLLEANNQVKREHDFAKLAKICMTEILKTCKPEIVKTCMPEIEGIQKLSGCSQALDTFREEVSMLRREIAAWGERLENHIQDQVAKDVLEQEGSNRGKRPRSSDSSGDDEDVSRVRSARKAGKPTRYL